MKQRFKIIESGEIYTFIGVSGEWCNIYIIGYNGSCKRSLIFMKGFKNKNKNNERTYRIIEKTS